MEGERIPAELLVNLAEIEAERDRLDEERREELGFQISESSRRQQVRAGFVRDMCVKCIYRRI